MAEPSEIVNEVEGIVGAVMMGTGVMGDL